MLPGERVRVEVERSKPGIAWTRLREVLAPAPERVSRRPVLTSPVRRMPLSARAVRSAVAGQAGDPGGDAAARGQSSRRKSRRSPREPWDYRNRSLFHVRGQPHRLPGGPLPHALPGGACPICSPAVNRTLGALLEMTRDRRWPNFLRSIEIFTNETDVQLNVLETERPVAKRFFEWCAERIPGLVSGALDYPLDGVVYRVSSGSFFQVNRFLTGQAGGDGAGRSGRREGARSLRRSRPVFDPAGAAIPAGDGGGIERGRRRDLLYNAERAGVSRRGSPCQGGRLPGAAEAAPDFVLLDPPRDGIGKEVVRRLAELKPRGDRHRIVRSGDAGARPGRTDWRGLPTAEPHFCRLISPDIPH